MLLRQVRGHAHVPAAMPAAIAAAAAAIRGPQQAAYEEAGFTRRSVRMPSGEEVSYLSRRSTTDPPERCVVFLHGMTSDALGSAAAVVPIASRQPPGVHSREPRAFFFLFFALRTKWRLNRISGTKPTRQDP